MVEGIKKEDARQLLKSELFSNMLPLEQDSIMNRTGAVTLPKGAFLFSPGEKAKCLYILLEGRIRVVKGGEDGVNAEIAHFTAGDLIGDFDFARGAEYDAYAEAQEDSQLAAFPGPGITFEAFAHEEPFLFPRILLNSIAMLTGRIKSARKLILESAYWVKELYRKAYEDSATGLWKQTFLDDEINRVLEDPTALIMLKPDKFKIFVDTKGHEAGDEVMVKIASVLKNVTHRLDRGWALRFRSNETGLLINKCDAALAESLAFSLSSSIASLPGVSLDEKDFSFSCSIAWGVWPVDRKSWTSLFEGTYKLLMDTWKIGGNRVVRFKKGETS